MFKQITILASLAILLASCNNSVQVLNQLETEKDVKMYFISSEIMGPNTSEKLHPIQTNNHSFYIDDTETISKLKEEWVFESTEEFDHFMSSYNVTYTEDGVYRGKITLDLKNKLAISGFGPSKFEPQLLEKHSDNFKKLSHQFIEFNNLESARLFYDKIKELNWLLPSENDEEFYIWSQYNGECIVQVNNKAFARDKDIAKAFKKYMPKRFPDQEHHYNIFKFTPENSTIRICSQEDLSKKFPEDFHILIPWSPFKTVILPLVNFDSNKLQVLLSEINETDYRIIDKIE